MIITSIRYLDYPSGIFKETQQLIVTIITGYRINYNLKMEHLSNRSFETALANPRDSFL